MRNITYTIIVVLIALALGTYFQNNHDKDINGSESTAVANSPIEVESDLLSNFQSSFIPDFRQDKNDLKEKLAHLTSVLDDEVANVEKLIAAQDASGNEGIKVVLLNELSEAQLQKAILSKKIMALEDSDGSDWEMTKESVENFINDFDEGPADESFDEELATQEYHDLSS